MAVRVTYNEFGSVPDGQANNAHWDAVNITDYAMKPVYADDEITPLAMQHTIIGTALIGTGTAADLETRLNLADARLRMPGRKLQIQWNDGSQTIINYTEAAEDQSTAYTTDELEGYPRCEFNVNRIIGTPTAVVGFRIIWNTFDVAAQDGTSSFDVVSHVWRASWDSDRDGHQTWRIEGSLQVRANASTTAGTSPNLGDHADRYRNLVRPNLPPGFRMERESWGVDETGRILIYEQEYKEYSRGLPDPARTGNGRFTFTRDLGESYLGIKAFEAELVGDKSASRTDLLRTLINVSKRRIQYGPPKSDLIRRIEIGEADIFERNRISLSIIAQSGAGGRPAFDEGIEPSANTDLTFGSFFAASGPGGVGDVQHASAPNPYGSALIRSVRKALFQPQFGDDGSSGYTDETFPIADFESSADDDFPDYEIPEEQATSALSRAVERGFAETSVQQSIESNQLIEFPYLSVKASHFVDNQTGMTNLNPQALNASSIPFQWSKPRVRIRSVFSAVRLNHSPARLHSPAPQGATLIRERFFISNGPVDANHNQTFIGHYVRDIELADGGTGSGRGSDEFANQTVNVPGLGTITHRTFSPTDGLVRAPFNPMTESQGNIANTGIFSQHPNGETWNFSLFLQEPYFND